MTSTCVSSVHWTTTIETAQGRHCFCAKCSCQQTITARRNAASGSSTGELICDSGFGFIAVPESGWKVPFCHFTINLGDTFTLRIHEV